MSAEAPRQPVPWPDEVDEIFAGDLVVVVGSPTPMGGVVLNSVTPIGLRDRRAGTVTFTTSLGFGRKLERIAADPRIAVAYHTRQHGYSDRPGIVLVQGVASVAPLSEQVRDGLVEQAARHIGQVVQGRLWDRWLKVYYLDRVGVDVAVQRIVWWSTGSLRDKPVVLGTPLPDAAPASQSRPRDPATPRVSMRKVRRSTAKQHHLVGYLSADGMPFILPVSVSSTRTNGLILANDSRTLPPGGRRAGFLAHEFRPKLIGLSAATHTGWLDVGDTALWIPHSRHSFTAPPNKTLLLLGNGAAARWGYRQALRQGRSEVLRRARAGMPADR